MSDGRDRVTYGTLSREERELQRFLRAMEQAHEGFLWCKARAKVTARSLARSPARRYWVNGACRQDGCPRPACVMPVGKEPLCLEHTVEAVREFGERSRKADIKVGHADTSSDGQG